MKRFCSKKYPSGFSAKSTAEEVTEGIDGSGLTAIVTGASSGIGAETARVLAFRGVHVVMGVRNVLAAKNVRGVIVEQNPTAKIDIMELDLSSFESVKNFASNYQASGLPLNILINNAGLISPFKLSKGKMELIFATNHLGHFLLTNLLLDTMKETAQKSGKQGRIAILSSESHRFSYCRGIRFNKINNRLGFVSFVSYGQSKLANILHANELARRLKEDGINITVNSLHPGVVDTKILQVNKISSDIFRTIFRFLFKSVEQGATTACNVALHPQVKGVNGEYFVNSNISKANSQARDLALTKKLWDFSIDLING